MVMNFFAAQDQARRNTLWLVLWFAILVITLVALTDALVLMVLLPKQPAHQALSWSAFMLQHSQLIVAATVVVLTGIIGAMLVRQMQLSEGGAAVARMLGGEVVDAGLLNSERFCARFQLPKAKLQQALNIVEEMAIAAGVPPPPLYLMSSSGINAFAAGYDSDDAVIGLTTGAIEHLSRDELQGVVAHEFSHIFNGDMRLNIRLMAMIFSLTCIYELGQLLLRGRDSSREGAAVAGFGLGLISIGAVGVFFASLLRAAVSRQREYLADSSAVQYTRNPYGIAGALYKIGQLGSKVQMVQAQEAGHFFLSDVRLTSFNFSSFWASHPPLDARIQALLPGWTPEQAMPLSVDRQAEPKTETPSRTAASTLQSLTAAMAMQSVADAERSAASQQAQQLLLQTWQSAMHTRLHALVALANTAHVDASLERSALSLGDELQRLDGQVLQLIRHPDGAEGLVYASVLSDNGLAAQLALLKTELASPVWQAVDQLVTASASMSLLIKLMLLQLATPVLRDMSQARRSRVQQCLKRLMLLDHHIEPQESLVWLWLSARVTEPLKHAAPTSLADASAEITHLLAVAAQLSHCKNWQDAALQHLPAHPWQFPSIASVESFQLAAHLPKLLALTPAHKQALWQALQAVTLVDQQLSVHELSLLHLYAILLDLPLQPA